MKLQAIAVLGAAALACLSADAWALSIRTFVSGGGADAGGCALAAPCRTFQYAHDQTMPNGEIAILDTAGYGKLTITKAISIVNPGGPEGAIAVQTGDTAVTVNAGISDKVSLRGLTLDGQGVGATGILLLAGSLDIIDSVIRNFTANNIDISPSFGGRANILNTTVSGAGSNQTGNGIRVGTVRTTIFVSINRSSLIGNAASGLSVSSGTFPNARAAVTVSDTVLSNNLYGVSVTNLQGNDSIVALEGSRLSGNGNCGISVATTGSIVRLSRSAVTLNGAGACFNGGVVTSLGTNLISDNSLGDATGGSIGSFPQK